jgi:hypothetical protein
LKVRAGGRLFGSGSLTYRYFGFITGQKTEVCTLDKVTWANTTSGAHAAVWLGRNNSNLSHWIQGGVEVESYNNQPNAYIEIQGAETGNKYQLHTWPVEYGTKVTVKLTRPKLGTHRCHISWTDKNGVAHSQALQTSFRSIITDAMLEILGQAAAIGSLNGKVVKGNTLTKS